MASVRHAKDASVKVKKVDGNCLCHRKQTKTEPKINNENASFGLITWLLFTHCVLQSSCLLCLAYQTPKTQDYVLSFIMTTQFQLEALALGQWFWLLKRRINRISAESQFEQLFCQLIEIKAASITDLDVIKSQLVNMCKTFPNKEFILNKLLSNAHILGLKDWLNNKDLLITRPNKGSGNVIMDRSEYVQFSSVSQPWTECETSVRVAMQATLQLITNVTCEISRRNLKIDRLSKYH